MKTKEGRRYTLYNRFRADLDAALTQPQILDVFTRLLPIFGADTAAIMIQSKSEDRSLAVGPQFGEIDLWHDYRALPLGDREAISRLVRLCNAPVQYSDVQNRGRLRSRLSIASILLFERHYNDAFVVPLFDRSARHAFMVATGRTLTLSPKKQFWFVQAARDIAARISQLNEGSLVNVLSATEVALPALTPRQQDVAPWLVQGKSDWEIGQILDISEKTANYHVENMKRLYGVKTRAQFVAAYVRQQPF